MQKIIDKVRDGGRLTLEEGIHLVEECDVHTLGELGLKARQKHHGDKAYYVYNQHLNYTNVCANQCKFCAFHKDEGEDGSFTLSVEEAQARIRKRAHEPIKEVHIVGGLNQRLPYEYYMDLVSGVKSVREDMSVKAFTAVEVAYLASQYGKTHQEVLQDLRDAGLDALPGGGAEVFSPRLREKLCPEKVSGEVWLKVHKLAHNMGIRTNCTLLFGHIESWRDRLEHMLALRDLQDRTGGFLCFIPLQYQPHNNPLDAGGTDGVDYLKMIAMSRLFLDNVQHIKAYWAFSGIKPAQMALSAGADDFDGTIVEEKVGHAAGASSPKGMTIEKLRECIREAGFDPRERNTQFKVF